MKAADGILAQVRDAATAPLRPVDETLVKKPSSAAVVKKPGEKSGSRPASPEPVPSTLSYVQLYFAAQCMASQAAVLQLRLRATQSAAAIEDLLLFLNKQGSATADAAPQSDKRWQLGINFVTRLRARLADLYFELV